MATFTSACPIPSMSVSSVSMAKTSLIALDLAGLAVSSGSACLVGSVQPSHVLEAMGVPADWASATVRFSIGPQIRNEDFEEIVSRIRQVVSHQRKLRGWTVTPSASLEVLV